MLCSSVPSTFRAVSGRHRLLATTSFPSVRRVTAATLCLSLAVSCGLAGGQEPAVQPQKYELGPDSLEQPGVPRGEVVGFTLDPSEVFPGTKREVQVYVPSQYDADKPAAVMVFQDGPGYVNPKGNWRVPTVFDNLIHRGEMPVTIGVFVPPGVVPSGDDEAMDRFNRSLEYDAVSDRYSRFLIEEVLPAVAGRYSVTDDPNLRGIAGSSSGAIAAFGVAWHRPDQFRRVFSTIGTYVGLRGGDVYPTLIRKTRPKPIKIFLQDGSNDLNIYGGDWWVANQGMLSALTWAGYDVEHRWGDGGHNAQHGGAIFPEAMRWLWADADRAIPAAISDRHELAKVLDPAADWELVSEGHQFTEGPAVSPDGDVYFADVPKGEIWRVGAAGQTELFLDGLPGVSGLMFDAQGRLYGVLSRAGQLVRIDTKTKEVTVLAETSCNDLIVLPGGVYITDPRNRRVVHVPLDDDGNSGLSEDESPRVVATEITAPNGLITTPDNRFLLVSDSAGRYVWSYRIEPGGTLAYGQPYHHVHLATDETRTGADGATMTRDGYLYLATSMGVQVFDQPGRCHAIIPAPRGEQMTNLVFAGPEMNVLYATIGGKLYRLPTKVTGIAPWQPPVKPERPRL
ncbi:MAG: gluconolactonase [Planctomycetaceae bacterium]|nr:MAG: gluconolactonase [Planctomycetaceae bacterium]